MNNQSTDNVARMRNITNHLTSVGDRRPRVLVTIASYGTKNMSLLARVIDQWRSMTQFDVTIVIVTEAERHFADNVEVVVGLPSRDPWSLPFAHKKILAERVEQFDLFVYSEDDMEVTQAHLHAFLEVTSRLPDNEIAGFLRYEVDCKGNWSYPDVHAYFHWDPQSARRVDDDVFAYFTNEHAAFYVLTAAHLRRAIDSGGFLRPPYAERYDMLCSAATDPYTSCGFRKVVCISRLESFSIHHLSDRYVGIVGISKEDLERQIDAQLKIADGRLTSDRLLNSASRMTRGHWSKVYYEAPDENVLHLIPESARTLLSVGCGWGATESLAQKRGVAVTALPLDAVVGASAGSRGIEVVTGSLADALSKLRGRRFDCLLIADLLHLQPDPSELLDMCLDFVNPDGVVVVKGPNFASLRTLAKRAMKREEYEKLRSFEESGISTIGPISVERKLRRHGLRRISISWSERTNHGQTCQPSNRWLATEWVLAARRNY